MQFARIFTRYRPRFNARCLISSSSSEQLNQFDDMLREYGFGNMLEQKDEFDEDTDQYLGYDIEEVKSSNRRETLGIRPGRADKYGIVFMALANLLQVRVNGDREFEHAIIESFFEGKDWSEVLNLSREDLGILLDRCALVYEKTFGNDDNGIVVNKTFRDISAVVLASQLGFKTSYLHSTKYDPELIYRQLQSEQKCLNSAKMKTALIRMTMFDLGKGNDLFEVAKRTKIWIPELAKAIKNEQLRIFHNINRKLDKDQEISHRDEIEILTVDPDSAAMAALTLVMSDIVREKDGISLPKLAEKLGNAVMQDSAAAFENDEERKALLESIISRYENDIQFTEKKRVKIVKQLYSMFNEIQAISSGENSVKGVEHIAKLGLSIITVLSKAEILDPVKSAGNTEKKLNPLSQENPKVLLCFKQQTLKKSAGYATLKKVRVTESAMQDLASVDFAPLSELAPVPMLTIPKVWNSTKNGGYFDIKTSFLRVKESRYQTEVLNNANLTKMYQAANALGKTPWKVNRDIYELMMTCWDRKIKIGKIPSRMDFDVPEVDPELFKNMSKAEKRTVRQQNQTISQKNAELHSLRCDFLLRVNVAKDLLDDVIYFPYNFDFRGRAYPIPPHLNHMGSDIARSLLTFARSMPVTERGIFWMKVQAANLFGNDKISFDDRVQWIDDNWSLIQRSVMDPIPDITSTIVDGNLVSSHPSDSLWWTQAEDPWQFLATTRELCRILNSSDPADYPSCLSVHQDGSCNGLQHYAALGRDFGGGQAVNLTPSDKPQDVYSKVLSFVNQRLEADAAGLGDSINTEFARALLGKVNRKTIKQTVMTSVYGVTFIGARDQILKQLDDRMDINWNVDEDKRYRHIHSAAGYLAKTTLSSIGDLFTNAKDIMAWLTKISRIVAEQNVPMSWITPLGLPVVQPYRKKYLHHVNSSQYMKLALDQDQSPIQVARQSSAFPPNFVHSLDSTHMLMTALECEDAALEFTAVHDSYWTHAATVDDMSMILRNKFVALHESPVLENLYKSVQMRFPQIKVPQVPKRGNLDLGLVRTSPYFFN